jgi:D-aspartate ligase
MASGPIPNPPVIVLGVGVTALGVLRILYRDGLTAYLAEGTDAMLAQSRAYRSLPPGNTSFTGGSLDAWLRSLTLERAVLMPCSDEWVARVAALEPAIRVRFPASVSALDTIEKLVDKGQFAALLLATETPHPYSRIVSTQSDLDHVPDEVFASAILKPRDSQRFMRRFRVKAFHVASRADAREQLNTLTEQGFPMILQEYVPGPATAHYFVDGFIDRVGRVRGVFVRQRLRMYPLDFGNSTYMVSVVPDAAAPAVTAISALLKHAGYRGMFSAEFKRDERDGLFKILEVNARAWWYVDFAARCGVDVCRMAYDDALERPVAGVDRYDVGKSLVFPYSDYFACQALRARGELSVSGWLASWVSSMQPVSQWRDPVPGVRASARVLAGFARTRLASLVGKR